MSIMKQMTNGKVVINVGRTAVFALIALIGVIFLVYYERRFSFAFVAAFVFAVAASSLLAYIPASKISAYMELSHEIINKGEEVLLKLTIINSNPLPISFLFVSFHNEWLLSENEGERYVITVTKNQPGFINKKYRAEIWGTASLGVSSIAIHDFLGLFKVAYNDCLPLLTGNVSIRPAIHESQKNDYIAYLCNKIVCDEKEDGSNIRQSFLAQPGYEHRPYVPGDPLKRINWKLSARLDRYMIRENEYLIAPVPIIVLDCCGIRQGSTNEWLKDAALLEERVIEGVLSMADSMLRQNLSCNVFFYYNDAWQSLLIEDKNQIMVLRQMFSKYIFADSAAERIPGEVFVNGSTIALFTPAMDGTLRGEVLKAASSGAVIDVICPMPPMAETSEQNLLNSWLVDEAYSFYAISHEGGNI